MSENPSIDLARLKEITKKAQEPGLKRKQLAEKKEARRVKIESERIAKEVIASLAALLEQEAHKGRDSLQVMPKIRKLEEKEAAKIVIAYCRKQGLSAELCHFSPGSDDLDDAHDYIMISWN